MKSFMIFMVLFATLLLVQDISAFPKTIESGDRVDKSLLFVNSSVSLRVYPCQYRGSTIPCKDYWTNRRYALKIIGKATGGRFTINFYGPEKKNDILYHFDVRINWSGKKNVVVQNTWIGGHWGKETARQYKPDDFPFKKNKEFTLLINRRGSEIKVDADGKPVMRFPRGWRYPSIDKFYISGSVKAIEIKFVRL